MVKIKRIGIVFMIISALLTATGQLMWKIGIDNIICLMLGFIFYGIGAVFMIKGFEREKLSIAYPIMCVGYAISMFYGAFFLQESITLNKVIAIFLISIGVFINSYDK